MPVMLIDGTEDDRVLWTGRDNFLGVMETASRFFEVDGCDDASHTEALLDDVDPDDGVRVRRHEWTCEQSAVQVIELSGGGHSWPTLGEGDGKSKGHICKDIEASDEILAFLLPQDD